jgi:membrane-bound metal-dependent hydrolase YbcI (DUF457 family)
VKAIAHFVTGVAIATFFPEIVDRAAGGSVLPVLGGIAGILPDTLDFKFVRYMERYHLEIDPGPEPDAGEIAEQVADAVRLAYQSREPRSIMLHTIRLGSDLWRRYTLRFDPQREEVAVRIGPIVDTGQHPLPGSEPPEAMEARAQVGAPLLHTYDEEIEVDIFSGPSFRFERQGDHLHVCFLDWHRRWSHSLTLAAALGIGTAGVAALVEILARGGVTSMPLWAGLVVALGLLAHVLEDQLGFMGSNLLFPLTRARTRGMGLLRSGDAVPNFLTVWAALMLILFNLDRFSARPALTPWWAFLGLAVGLPVILLGGMHRWQRRGRRTQTTESLRQQEILSEAEETDVS